MKPDTVTMARTQVTASARPQSAARRWWWGAAAVLVVGVGIGVWTFVFGGKQKLNGDSPKPSTEFINNANGPVKVDVIVPKPGGISRLCVQPGSIEPFESANLYAKASGFLLETVDINTRVKSGDILAKISVPEYEKQVSKDKALVANANAKVAQMQAALHAAQSEEKASHQMIALAKVVARAKGAYREYRSKQLERIKALYADSAIDAKLVDESVDNHEAAVEAENAAKEAITTNELKWEASKAKVEQSRADLTEAQSAVQVAQAELDKAEVLLGYTVIKSPYDGVVTKRNFFRGDAIRAFDAGGTIPVVSVDRTDLMRCVIQVPETDVPYLDVGDQAEISFASMGGRTITGKVARMADELDEQTRTMRTEIDIPNNNPEVKLCRNMYGHAVIKLSDGLASTMRVPSSAIFAKNAGKAKVRVADDNRIRIVDVKTGLDDGKEVEILHGLTPTDRVVLHANGPLRQGTEVEITGDNTTTASTH